LGKTVPEVLSTARGRRPRAVLKTEGTVFPNTDRPKPANNVSIFFLSLENYFFEIFVLIFTEAVSHRARAFDVSVKQTRVVYKVFKRQDSVFTDFRTEQ